MAGSGGKKQAKAGASSVRPRGPAPPVTPAPSSSTPTPFVPAPTQLRPLTSTLPTDHVYLLHTDSNPIALKKRVFSVPVLLNLVITALLAVRVYFAAPVYLEQLITIFGYDTAWKVEPDSMAYADVINVIVNRTGLLMMDYAIFGMIGSWPWEFFFGSKYSRHTGAVSWRRQLGFRDTEIVVRKGRKWDGALFADENQTWSREDELLLQFKVEEAMRKTYTSKTGYLLLDKEWDLDFKSMVDAHRLVEKGRIELKELDHIVLVHYKKQWLLWRVHGDDDGASSDAADRDPVILNFRTKLAALGHEDVFFRWIEIVQYETSLPGGFTPAKQKGALAGLKRLLDDRGANFDQFLQSIGGQSQIPGLTNSG